MADITVVTSWDDGDALDLRLADLLKATGVRGTFYIARSTCGLSHGDLRHIAEHHEIGSHTSSHAICGENALTLWLGDVRAGREWLEDVLGRPVPSFAYPGGVFTADAARALREVVGSARTTLLGVTSEKFIDPWRLHTTVHARSFELRHRLSGLLRGRWSTRRSWALLDWPGQIAAAASAPDTRVLHLWGHSWEIEQGDLWMPLERCLRDLASGMASTLTVAELVERGGELAAPA